MEATARCRANPFRDQGFRTVDASITKAFKFKERLTAQFRAEFFNVLNHPNFVNPTAGLAEMLRPLIPQARAPRQRASAMFELPLTRQVRTPCLDQAAHVRSS